MIFSLVQRNTMASRKRLIVGIDFGTTKTCEILLSNVAMAM